jgi:CubicO group peptidase (beta-lactamase class C family)
MAPSINPAVAAALESYIDKLTLGDNPVLPGAVVHVVDAHNNTLFTHGSSSTLSLSKNSMASAQSVSKLVGAIAYLQLVDRGLATLDDPQLITTHLPELAALKVLTGYEMQEDGTKKWLFEDRKGDITPRMLLNHTAGLGYIWFDTLIADYLQDRLGPGAAQQSMLDPYNTLLATPLLHQPGTTINYGQGLEWIGILIERLTQQSLETYLREHIFTPLNLHEMGYMSYLGGDVLHRPTNAGKFWLQTLRTPQAFHPMDPTEPVLITRPDTFPTGPYHTGLIGAGLAVSAADYAHLVTVLLPANAGVDPVTRHRVLSATAVSSITSPSLPAHLRDDARVVRASGIMPVNFAIALDAPQRDPHGSYGLACAVQGRRRELASGKRGRSAGSVYWYGMANAEYWVDGEAGVVVFVNGNFMPWNDEAWVEFVAGVEGLVYEGLE